MIKDQQLLKFNLQEVKNDNFNLIKGAENYVTLIDLSQVKWKCWNIPKNKYLGAAAEFE